jgi:CHAD domain-containing protein
MPILSKASSSEFDSPVERLLASIANLVQQPKSKGVHFYRTSLRRFQAWSDVFHPKTDSRQKQALRFLDQLRKATGKLRDSEVHLDLLKAVNITGEERKTLQKVLKARRNSYEQKLRALLRDPIVASIWRTLRPFDQAPNGNKEIATFHPIDGMTTLALDEYRAFVQRHGKITPDNLHEYRLECKRFRYTAELAGETPEVNALVEIWKGVQDVIGEWHDYLTLTQLAEDVLGDSPAVATLQEMTHKKYQESFSAIENAERKLIVEAVPKKKPHQASSGRRSRAA